jgi:hypothetical protein
LDEKRWPQIQHNVESAAKPWVVFVRFNLEQQAVAGVRHWLYLAAALIFVDVGAVLICCHNDVEARGFLTVIGTSHSFARRVTDKHTI